MHRRLAVLLMVALAAACGGRTGHTAQPAARTPIAPSTGATQPASNIPVSSSPAHTKGSHARTMTGGTHTSSPAATSGSKSGPSPAASGGSNATPAKPRQPGTYTYDTSGQTTYGDAGVPNPTFGQLAAVGNADNAVPAFANVDPPRMFQLQVRFVF